MRLAGLNIRMSLPFKPSGFPASQLSSVLLYYVIKWMQK